MSAPKRARSGGEASLLQSEHHEAYFAAYADLTVHTDMLRDSTRTSARAVCAPAAWRAQLTPRAYSGL